MSPVIDVHTHMLNNEWLKLLEKHGRPRYTLKAVTGGRLRRDGARQYRRQGADRPGVRENLESD